MSKSKTTIQKSAKSVEEAIELALAELGVSKENAEINVIDEGSKGFLGIGSKDAVVEVSATIAESEADTAKKFLSDIFNAMNLNVEIDAKEKDDTLDINLSGDSMGIIIGKRGDTLDSLQYLTSIVVNKRVSLDTENFRERRVETLKGLSARLADKVAKSHKKYTLEPMNAYERRIIHASLQNDDRVTTFSVGEDPFRKVVIAPKDRERAKNSAPKRPMPVRTSPVKDYVPEQKEPAATPKRIEIPKPTKPAKPKVGSFEEYLAEQEKNN